MFYLFKHVDKHMHVFRERLAQLIGIKTVAEEVDQQEIRFEMGRAVKTISEFLRDKLDMSVQVVKNHKQYLPGRYPTPDPEPTEAEGDPPLFKKDDLPPFILAERGHDVNKMTVLIYGHLDTTPACQEDGWRSDPFQLDEDDQFYYGRGTSDCKGQFLAWLCALESFVILNIEIPLNIRIVIECLEETSSEGLQELIFEKRNYEFFRTVDFVISSDSYWLTDTKPCISHGCRGVNYFFVEVECANEDLHSGMHGGNVHEAMSDLIYLLNGLTYPNGYIRVPQFYDKVVRASKEEIDLHKKTTFSVDAYRREIGAHQLLHETKEELLDHRGVLPCLSIHGIKGSFDQVGSKFVIPKRVTGKFSIRIVPDQDPDEINKLVSDYVTDLHRKRSNNLLKIDCFRAKKAFRNEPFDISHRAAAEAIKRVWKQEPDHIRHGPAIPVMRVFQEILGKSCMLLPLCRASCANHIVNERIAKENFQNGIKVCIAYFFELSTLIAKELI